MNNWEKEFNKQFVEFYLGDSGIGGNDPQEPDEVLQAYPHEIRAFIKSLLHSHNEELIQRIERMKQPAKQDYENATFDGNERGQQIAQLRIDTCDDIINLLKDDQQ